MGRRSELGQNNTRSSQRANNRSRHASAWLELARVRYGAPIEIPPARRVLTLVRFRASGGLVRTYVRGSETVDRHKP
jgi:hypothetical protein